MQCLKVFYAICAMLQSAADALFMRTALSSAPWLWRTWLWLEGHWLQGHWL